MALKFDPVALRLRLGEMDFAKKLAFGILQCERGLPALQTFANQTGFSASLYLKCLTKAWLELEGHRQSDNYHKLATSCLDSAPDTEKFDHLLTSAGLDAAISISYLMDFLSDHDISHIIEIAKLNTDTVALFVQKTESPRQPLTMELEKIIQHPLLQQELIRQVNDLKFLDSLPSGPSEAIASAVREETKRNSGLLPIAR
jgi:uncharacterized protein YjaG (DUF416 family)